MPFSKLKPGDTVHVDFDMPLTKGSRPDKDRAVACAFVAIAGGRVVVRPPKSKGQQYVSPARCITPEQS